MKKLLCIMLLISTNAYAARPQSALVSANYPIIQEGVILRSEIRADTLSILNVNFENQDAVMRISGYFRDRGYQVSRVLAGVDRIGHNDRFDVAFMDARKMQDVDTEIRNLFRFMRPDGILFVEVRANEDLTLLIDDMILKVERFGNIMVLKRRFDNWEQFRDIMDGMENMVRTLRSA